MNQDTRGKAYDRAAIVRCGQCGKHWTTARLTTCWFCR